MPFSEQCLLAPSMGMPRSAQFSQTIVSASSSFLRFMRSLSAFDGEPKDSSVLPRLNRRYVGCIVQVRGSRCVLVSGAGCRLADSEHDDQFEGRFRSIGYRVRTRKRSWALACLQVRVPCVGILRSCVWYEGQQKVLEGKSRGCARFANCDGCHIPLQDTLKNLASMTMPA
jgi:hypothetical protein